eukprot:11337645-Ditylum_brightwellii.AAC.1
MQWKDELMKKKANMEKDEEAKKETKTELIPSALNDDTHAEVLDDNKDSLHKRFKKAVVEAATVDAIKIHSRL